MEIRNRFNIFRHSRVCQLQLLSVLGFLFVFSCARGRICFHVSTFIICTYEEKKILSLARRDLYVVASISPYNLSFCEAFDILFVLVFSEVHTSSFGH